MGTKTTRRSIVPGYLNEGGSILGDQGDIALVGSEAALAGWHIRRLRSRSSTHANYAGGKLSIKENPEDSKDITPT